MGEKSCFDAYILAASPLGLFGGLHFYLGRPHVGLLYACTAGVFGIGYVLDLFRTPWLVKEANTKRQHKKDPTVELPPRISLIDAYLMWFPLGIIGLHHVYLKKTNWALLYLLTAGLFCVGWIVDAFWMIQMVNSLNAKLSDPQYIQEKEKKKRMKKKDEEEMNSTDIIIANRNTNSIAGGETARSTPRQEPVGDVKQEDTTKEKIIKRDKELRATVALGLSPLGILGAHHFYLRRNTWWLLYLLTGGLAGLGWIYDWFRLFLLHRRCNAIAKGEKDRKEKTIDDAYVLWFPWGILGVHQFYLGRHGWGFIYLVTAGIFGIGWLTDAIRIPGLVQESNRRRIENQKDLDPDIDTNLTPPRDDYDTSLTLNLGAGSEGNEENGLDIETRRSIKSPM